MNKKLRKNLNTIVSKKKGSYWYIPDLFEKHTLPILPKDLKLIKKPPEKEKNYNCFLYALGLHKNPEIIKKTKGFIYSSFIEKLIEKQEIYESQYMEKGSIVFYKDKNNHPNEITHTGIVKENGNIVSKWSWGPLLEHKLFDVPLFYGNDVSFYKPISVKQALELYKKYELFNQY